MSRILGEAEGGDDDVNDDDDDVGNNYDDNDGDDKDNDGEMAMTKTTTPKTTMTKTTTTILMKGPARYPPARSYNSTAGLTVLPGGCKGYLEVPPQSQISRPLPLGHNTHFE